VTETYHEKKMRVRAEAMAEKAPIQPFYSRMFSAFSAGAFPMFEPTKPRPYLAKSMVRTRRMARKKKRS